MPIPFAVSNSVRRNGSVHEIQDIRSSSWELSARETIRLNRPEKRNSNEEMHR